MATIPIKNLNLGGIADSDYLGNDNSVAECVGLDIHSEAGVVKLNQKLTKESGSTIDDFVKASVSCSDGSTYLFGSTNGKIWKRASDGTYTLAATAAPAAGAIGILSAFESNGYIYYAMQSRLGRVAVGAPTDWSTRSDSYATFTNTDADFHPMCEVNLVLYIGDKNFVAQVDAGTFSANALDIRAPHRIKSLGKIDTDLLIGTFVANTVMKTEVIRWNTWSLSYSVSDPIPEVGINAFLDTDNMVIVSAGSKGNLYIYDGSRLELFKTIKGNWSSTNKATVHSGAVFNFNGLPLFGLSQVTGTGVNLGVYSLGSTSRGYPLVLNLEYPISEGDLTGIEIGSIVAISADQFIVSWKKASTYGVDKLDLALKQTSGYFITRVMQYDRMKKSNYGYVNNAYRELPTGTDIKVHKKVNHAGSFSQFHATTDMVTDVDRLTRYTKTTVGEASTLQLKIELTTADNNSPVLEGTEVDVT